MTRAARSTGLGTATARAAIPTGTRETQKITKGLALMYRRGRKGAGTWAAQIRDEQGSYVWRPLGAADDFAEPDGVAVLNHKQAIDAALAALAHYRRPETVPEAHGSRKGRGVAYTVADAIEDHLRRLGVEGKPSGHRAATAVAKTHILPALGHLPVAKLTADKLARWRDALAAAPPLRQRKDRPADPTARRATANRIFTVLKAALNEAHYRNRTGTAATPWRDVRPLRNANQVRMGFLSPEECTRLVNACDPDFRPIVHAALATGCRYGELASARVGDFNAQSGTLQVRPDNSKSGKARNVPLTATGIALFQDAALGKGSSDLLFTRANGEAWGHGHQQRRMVRASEGAAIKPAANFHGLRHTYASTLVREGVPLQIVAAVLGHSDVRITEKHYAHLRPDHVADVIRAALPDLGGKVVARATLLRPIAS